jgi:hypothetical protein
VRRSVVGFLEGLGQLQAARWDCHSQKVIAPTKSPAWIQSLYGLPFRTMAEPIMAADQAIDQSTSLVFDRLEEVIMV